MYKWLYASVASAALLAGTAVAAQAETDCVSWGCGGSKDVKIDIEAKILMEPDAVTLTKAYQNSTNVITPGDTNTQGDDQPDLIEHSTYDARILLGDEALKGQVGNTNNFNTGINAAQQGATSIAAAVSDGSDGGDTINNDNSITMEGAQSNDGSQEGSTSNTADDLSTSNDNDADLGDATTGGSATVTDSESLSNNNDPDATNNQGGSQMADGDATNTQTSGFSQSGTQFNIGSQEATIINYAVNGDNQPDALAVTKLKQVSVNRIAGFQHLLESRTSISDRTPGQEDSIAFEPAKYDARLDIGSNAMQNQVLNTNNFNTGVNAAQQGATSLAVSAVLGGGSIGNGTIQGGSSQ